MRCDMDFVLSRRAARLLVLAGSLACAGLLSADAIRRAVAAHWEGTRDPAKWAKAVRLEPANATYWARIGLYEQWDFNNGNLNQAIADFTKATRLDPRSARLWMALADAYEEDGEISKARQAYQKAEFAHPVSAQVAWRYGSFLLRRGEVPQAAEHVRRALVDRPELAASAVSQFWKSGAGTGVILNAVLPPNSEEYFAAIHFFLSHQQDDAALAAWAKLMQLGEPVKLDRALELVDDLIEENRMSDAERVWEQALTASGQVQEARRDNSLIFDGDFERSPVNGGFAWRQTPIPGTTFDLVSDVTHGSSQSARVGFNGHHNVDYANLSQFVAVEPGDLYRFSAFMRTEDISTDSGPQFQITGCTSPYAVITQTPGMTGTNPWTEVRTEFTTGAQVQCVRVVLRRQPSHLFSNRIRGMVWVDDVRLVKSAAKGNPPR